MWHHFTLSTHRPSFGFAVRTGVAHRDKWRAFKTSVFQCNVKGRASLQRVPQSLLELDTIGSAHPRSRPIFQHCLELAVRDGL